MAPEPEEASSRQSLLVPINAFRSARVRVYSVRKSAVRWCIPNAAIAFCAEGRSGVGPGVKSLFLRNMLIMILRRSTWGYME